jgi:proline iminopeptidase
MGRAIEVRREEPWFADAAKAIEEEQAGEFASAEELIANLKRQIPLYFHRWAGNEQTGRELAADFAQAEPLHHFNTVEFPTFDLRGQLRTFEVPTLVVVGDDDFICGPVSADAIVGALPDARLVTIADAGHFVYVEQPAAFRAALTDFLL